MPGKSLKPGEVFCSVSFVVLIVIVGVSGILQIRHLNSVIGKLGTKYSYLQKAILEMRINNNIYGRAVRDFALWKTTKFLESASNASSKEIREKAINSFDKFLLVYSQNTQATEQYQWATLISNSAYRLRELGKKIIKESEQDVSKTQLRDIKGLLMSFERQLYKIDNFLSDTVEKVVLEEIEEQLKDAQAQSKHSIILLGASSLLSIFIGAIISLSVYRNNRINEEKKKQLFLQMLEFEDEERQEIALQIHNEMGQNLSALKIHLELGNATQCKELLAELLDKMHNVVYFLRPPALEEVGLSPALEELLLQYHQRAGIEYTYQKPQKEIKLSPEYNLILYRVAQEALNNIAKHSKADRIMLALNEKTNLIKLTIEDNGVGFDWGKFSRNKSKTQMGLSLLKERVEIFGGRLSVVSIPGQGTKVGVWFSVNNKRELSNAKHS